MRFSIDIESLLGHGSEEAIKAEVLAKLLALSSTAELRREIGFSRRRGQLILSGQSGYYLPKDNGDITRFIKSMSHRARCIFVSIRAARQELERRNHISTREADTQMTLETYDMILNSNDCDC